MKKKLVIISNRLPVTVKRENDVLRYHASAGGLTTGLSSLSEDIERTWIGWPGISVDDELGRKKITTDFKAQGMVPVFLTDNDIELYYEGFSNKVIWPHFHYFTEYIKYSSTYWKAYKRVNEQFAEVVCSHLKGDEMVWVHDYQLMLLPALIRERFPQISIGFFLHIPFPSYEVFRILPWREALLQGVLGADQIGFHTFGYMRHFLSAAYRIMGHEHDMGVMNLNDRLVHTDVYPMGIDYEKFAFPETKETNEIVEYKKRFPNRKVILSVDRLDYTKGIPERIKAFEYFLSKNKAYHGRVTMMVVAVPSRANVDQYQELKSEIDTLTGRINGMYSKFDWTPIKYFYRRFDFEDLVQLYQSSDVALITPLRDGMNLIAKEYIASKQKEPGVIILSEMAGASIELTEALLINPHNKRDISNAIIKALEMPEKEQWQRLRSMQEKIRVNNVQTWAQTFIDEQIKLAKMQENRRTKILTPTEKSNLIESYQNAENRLLFLDYDGTLMDFDADPQAVVPDQELLTTLEQLANDPKNQVVVISGRDRPTLEGWLGHLNIDISCEHGVWSRINGTWNKSVGLFFDWKDQIRPVLENLVKRTPGTFVEEKDYSIAWHYRKVDKELGEKRMREFRDVLLYLTSNLDLQVLEGNKVIEIKNAGVNKGKSAIQWIQQKDWDFIFAIGDDHTDEDTFKVLPEEGVSVKVGLDISHSKYHVLNVSAVRDLLSKFVG